MKSNRGKRLNKLPSKGRGVCPVCGRTGIKLLFDYRTEDDKVLDVCKNCRTKYH